MDVHADLDAPCPVDVLFGWIDDLTRYRQWLDLVRAGGAGARSRGRPGPGLVGRPARLASGPLARVEAAAHGPHRVRGPVRRALRAARGRRPPPRVLGAGGRPRSTPTPDGCHLRMHLHYGGALFGPVLDRVLRDEIERSKPRLLELCRADHP